MAQAPKTPFTPTPPKTEKLRITSILPLQSSLPLLAYFHLVSFSSPTGGLSISKFTFRVVLTAIPASKPI